MNTFKETGSVVRVVIAPTGRLDFEFNRNGESVFRILSGDRTLSDRVFDAYIRHEMLNSNN